MTTRADSTTHLIGLLLGTEDDWPTAFEQYLALLAPRITRRLIEEFARRPAGADPDPAVLASLTAREREALELMARGLSNAEMATSLYVSEHTVKTHVGNVLAKLGLRDRIQAVILAYEVGLVQPGRG